MISRGATAGRLLFEMLAGQPPFQADTAGDLIAMHLREPPPPLRRKAPAVSSTTAALVASMLAKEPVVRPSMEQVAERLQQAAAAWRPRRPGVPRWILGAVPAGLAAGAVLLLLTRTPPARPASERAPVTFADPPAVPRTVWSLTSEPAGAEIVRSPDGLPLGRTPWRHEQDAQPGSLTVELRHPGHTSQTLVLDEKTTTERHVVLAPLPQAASQDEPEPPPAAALDAEAARTLRKHPSGTRKKGGTTPAAAAPSAATPVPTPPAATTDPPPAARPAPRTETPHEDVDVPPLR